MMITNCLAMLCITGAVAIDGDTMRLDSPGKNLRIRLWGINAPEIATPEGVEASKSLAQLIDGKSVACDLMDVDRYGRPVVRCATSDTPDIACELVKRGAATDWPKYSSGAYDGCASR